MLATRSKDMQLAIFSLDQSHEVIDLFNRVFSVSEGEQEGKVIANFVSNLITTTAPNELLGCVAQNKDGLVACVFFSRLMVPDEQLSFILSPVAVSTTVQRTGVGQKLIRFGLDQLALKGVQLVFTYGDPAYYAKTGFKPISENVVKAPFTLSQPIGWLAQALDGRPIKPMTGTATCVSALNDPSLW